MPRGKEQRIRLLIGDADSAWKNVDSLKRAIGGRTLTEMDRQHLRDVLGIMEAIGRAAS
jgi:hypothetical protein